MKNTMGPSEKINHLDLRRSESPWIAGPPTLIGALIRAGFLMVVVTVSASAQTGQEIATLKQQVAALQTTVSALQSQIKTIQSSNVFALNSFVSVDPNSENGVIGPHIIFKGANIHIVSGSGSTNDNGSPTGLGNLILGYDEDPALVGENPLSPGDRGGSHNLVIGRWHRFTRHGFGCLVAGEANTVDAEAATVTCGSFNIANAPFAIVSGGTLNTASGQAANVGGGEENTASGYESSVSGGFQNIASMGWATVNGGGQNVASAYGSSVIGGQGYTASNAFTIAPIGY